MRPLLPFADAFRERGHDVLIAIPESSTGLVLDAGHEAWALPQAPNEVSDAISARAQTATPDEANAIVVGELFAGTHARAALPGVMAAVAEWQPDVLVHETCEFAAALVGERAALPSVRVAVHMASLEHYIARFAAAEVDALRALLKIDRDPGGERLLAGRASRSPRPRSTAGCARATIASRRRRSRTRPAPGTATGGRSSTSPSARWRRTPAPTRTPTATRSSSSRRSTCACCSTRAAATRRSSGRCPRACTPTRWVREASVLPTSPPWSPTPALAACARRSRPACRSRWRRASAISRSTRTPSRPPGAGLVVASGRPDRRHGPRAAQRARLRGQGGRDRRRGRLPAAGEGRGWEGGAT